MKRLSGVVVFCALWSASPAMAATPSGTSHEARWLVPHGKGTREVKTVLTVEDEGLVLRSQSGDVLRTLPYESLKTVSHATTRHRRWVSGVLVGTLVNPIGLGLLFTRSERHYITFFQDDAATVIKLGGEDYANVLGAIASRTSQPLVSAVR